jgi:hypothetical protein
VSPEIRSSNEIASEGAAPNEMIEVTFELFFTPIIPATLSADVMIARAPQSLTTNSISTGVSMVLTGLITAPMRAMAK